MHQNESKNIWANYNDLSQGHPKWWFSKLIPAKIIVICPEIWVLNLVQQGTAMITT